VRNKIELAIHLDFSGAVDWGIIDPERVFNFSIAKAGSTTTITTSGKLFSAGYPSSFSLSALDLKYC
jgi:hypothetical protein